MAFRRIVLLSIISIIPIGLLLLFFPYKQALIFEETKAEHPSVYYLPLQEDRQFQINYVHSIHLSNVREQYKVTDDRRLQLLYMQYEDLAIGLPGYAEKGETFTVKDGLYTLSYDSNIIDSFVLYVGRVNTGLSLHYADREYDMKEFLEKGRSYEVRIAEVSNYDLLKGVDIHG